MLKAEKGARAKLFHLTLTVTTRSTNISFGSVGECVSCGMIVPLNASALFTHTQPWPPEPLSLREYTLRLPHLLYVPWRECKGGRMRQSSLSPEWHQSGTGLSWAPAWST